jgi:hypothetical protein
LSPLTPKQMQYVRGEELYEHLDAITRIRSRCLHRLRFWTSARQLGLPLLTATAHLAKAFFRAPRQNPQPRKLFLTRLLTFSQQLRFEMEGLQDDFKGFGDGAEGFPKHLPEDCVEYWLFIIDSRLKSQKELLVRLEAVRKESLKLTESLLKEYIWQRESFKLGLEKGKGMSHAVLSSISKSN